MSELTLKQFDELKNLLALKYAQLKATEKEVEFLKSKFTSILRFRDANDWKGKTDFATFNLKEGFRLSYPGNDDLDKKREFYTYMQKKDTPWYQQSISLNWNAVNAYANTEIDSVMSEGKEWEPWPHCERQEDLKFDMRVRPGIMSTLFDEKVRVWGFAE